MEIELGDNVERHADSWMPEKFGGVSYETEVQKSSQQEFLKVVWEQQRSDDQIR